MDKVKNAKTLEELTQLRKDNGVFLAKLMEEAPDSYTACTDMFDERKIELAGAKAAALAI